MRSRPWPVPGGLTKVPSDTPRQLAVPVQYFYDTENHDKFHGGCEGQGTRAFTLDRRAAR